MKYLHYQYGVTQVNPSDIVRFHKSNEQTSDSGKILHQHCDIYWQSKCKILVESANANNVYSVFCEVTLKHFSFRFLWTTSVLKLKWFGLTHKSRCSYCLLCQI